MLADYLQRGQPAGARPAHSSLSSAQPALHRPADRYPQRMPKRTTTFQMVVNFVRQHNAQPGITVTESKFLRNATLGVDREVDIVVEGSFDGDRIVTSIEVTEIGRPATVEWVERLIGKHRNLPTNRLLLVSKSGFSRSALAAVAAEGGWVAAATPQPVEVDGQPLSETLFMDIIQFSADAYRLVAVDTDRQLIYGNTFPDSVICDIHGHELGTAEELAKEVFQISWLRKKFHEMAHGHPERETLDSFECAIFFPELGYYLRIDATSELYLAVAAEFKGKFKWAQQELSFEFSYLESRQYAVAESNLFGQPAVWVASKGGTGENIKLSWRTKDDKPPLGHSASHAAQIRFPEVLTLQPPLVL
jgi:hypothetical protein